MTRRTPVGRPERPLPHPLADERTMLESWLDFHRTTLAIKCADLDDDALRERSVEPSAMTLLGLVQHMAEVERNWFQRIFAGQDLPQIYEEGDQDGFAVTPERGMDEAKATWQREIERGRELIASASLDDSGRVPERYVAVMGADTVSLRWILVHMIEEYARHNGHADLLRERIDGSSGT